MSPDHFNELLADRDYQEEKAQKNRSDFTRAHGLLCDLHRRLSAALLPGQRTSDWDDIVVAAERLTSGNPT
jgi:hypothetical protein